jgi:hypothetical protein
MGTLSALNCLIKDVSDHFAAGRWVKIEKKGFKVGDTVICKSESYRNMLVQGKSYVIVEMDIDNFVKVSSLDGGYFIDYWFKLDRFI